MRELLRARDDAERAHVGPLAPRAPRPPGGSGCSAATSARSRALEREHNHAAPSLRAALEREARR